MSLLNQTESSFWIPEKVINEHQQSQKQNREVPIKKFGLTERRIMAELYTLPDGWDGLSFQVLIHQLLNHIKYKK